jgi:hypothetical protein
VLIERGEIERGVALLDEVMVAVTAGEISAIIAGIIYCSVLSACAELFDIRRAREWTHALTRWCESQTDMVQYRGECLVHRAEVASLQGVWPEALNEALLACERLSQPPGQPAFGAASTMIHGLARDAKRIADIIERRTRSAEAKSATHDRGWVRATS